MKYLIHIYLLPHFFIYVNVFSNNLKNVQRKWHITFKVGDVLEARISKPEGLYALLTPPSGLQGFQNVGAGRRGNGRTARDLADRSPGAA